MKLLKNTVARINHSKYFFSTRTRTLQRNFSQQKWRGEKGFQSGQSTQYSGRQSSISIMYRVGSGVDSPVPFSGTVRSSGSMAKPVVSVPLGENSAPFSRICSSLFIVFEFPVSITISENCTAQKIMMTTSVWSKQNYRR